MHSSTLGDNEIIGWISQGQAQASSGTRHDPELTSSPHTLSSLKHTQVYRTEFNKAMLNMTDLL